MSFSMFAVPIPTDPPPPTRLELKHAFARQFLPGTDGSLRCDPVEFKDERHISVVITWLRGYATAATGEVRQDALDMIAFFEQNPQGVLIWIGDWFDGPYGDAVEMDDNDDVVERAS